jgi:hypothetical protein
LGSFDWIVPNFCTSFWLARKQYLVILGPYAPGSGIVKRFAQAVLFQLDAVRSHGLAGITIVMAFGV